MLVFNKGMDLRGVRTKEGVLGIVCEEESTEECIKFYTDNSIFLKTESTSNVSFISLPKIAFPLENEYKVSSILGGHFRFFLPYNDLKQQDVLVFFQNEEDLARISKCTFLKLKDKNTYYTEDGEKFLVMLTQLPLIDTIISTFQLGLLVAPKSDYKTRIFITDKLVRTQSLWVTTDPKFDRTILKPARFLKYYVPFQINNVKIFNPENLGKQVVEFVKRNVSQEEAEIKKKIIGLPIPSSTFAINFITKNKASSYPHHKQLTKTQQVQAVSIVLHILHNKFLDNESKLLLAIALKAYGLNGFNPRILGNYTLTGNYVFFGKSNRVFKSKSTYSQESLARMRVEDGHIVGISRKRSFRDET